MRWRSLRAERERLAGVAPGADDRDGVLALLLALHDAVAPAALGAAINVLDREDERLRINRVRYYSLDGLRDALKAGTRDKKLQRRLDEIFP